MRSLWLAVALCACGDVQKVPDAAIQDAYVPDSPGAPLTCATGEMNCNGTCANLLNSEQFCGSCTTSCSPTQGCLNGTCVPANTSCTRVKELDPEASDGAYRNPNTNNWFYCDFANSMTYEGFGFGQNTAGYANYVQMTLANFNDPAIQKAFVALYNAQTGLINLGTGWNSPNCCFKCADCAASQYLAFNSNYLYPARVDGPFQECGGPYNQLRYRFYDQNADEYSPLPMPADFFTTHVVGTNASCSDSFPMPSVFMRRRSGLN
jgi:hypothetical protein